MTMSTAIGSTYEFEGKANGYWLISKNATRSCHCSRERTSIFPTDHVPERVASGR